MDGKAALPSPVMDVETDVWVEERMFARCLLGIPTCLLLLPPLFICSAVSFSVDDEPRSPLPSSSPSRSPMEKSPSLSSLSESSSSSVAKGFKFLVCSCSSCLFSASLPRVLCL